MSKLKSIPMYRTRFGLLICIVPIFAVWLYLALAMPIVALSVRAKFVGDFQDMSREPYAIIEGIFIALVFLASL